MPICRALSAHGIKIAPRTYWARARRPPSRRALADARITEILAGIYEPGARGRRKPESLYGSLKMWEHLNRQGIPVARCTVERLMAASRWRGVTRARTVRTTTPDPAHSRAPDLVKRDFKASAPGQLHVADFTYVPLDGGGFGYTAFVIDAFAGLIAGWECSLSKETAFVERAIRQAAALRARQGHPISGAAIHHSDAGSQYTSLRFAQTLMLAGLSGSVGSVGDAYDNALAETQSAFTKPNVCGLGRRSATAPSAPWLTWRKSPAHGCTGTTPKGSCTAWDASHPPRPKPGTGRGRNTWLDMGPSRRAATGPGRQRIKDPARRPARLRPSAPCQATYPLEGGRPGNLTTAAATRRNCTHETRCARNSGCSKKRRSLSGYTAHLATHVLFWEQNGSGDPPLGTAGTRLNHQ